MLRKALILANSAIAREERIVGVMIDTNSRIVDLSPPVEVDPSTRGQEDAWSFLLFPPLVLTRTMDANWRQYCRDELEERNRLRPSETSASAGLTSVHSNGKVNRVSMDDQLAVYKPFVVGDDRAAWDVLKRMGRPLWHGTIQGLPGNKATVISLAARKLMLGANPKDEKSYTNKTMFGVASMLCRLGVRLFSNSALASRLVADFMSILAYVNYTRDRLINSYDSALGRRAAEKDRGRQNKMARKPERQSECHEDKMYYTLCFRSVTTASFPFLDEKVAKRLVNIVTPEWSARTLVDGDLKERDADGRIEKLAMAMPRAELEDMALDGMQVLAYAPGCGDRAEPVWKEALEVAPRKRTADAN